MKIVRKTIAVLIVLAMMISCGIIAGNTATISFFGDVDNDGALTSVDATMIQRYEASMIEFTKRQQFFGDVDNNGETDIVDATRVQRRIVGIKDGFYSVYELDTDTSIQNFCADYDSGLAMAGVPVTFYVTGRGFAPLSYEYYVDGDIVQERSGQDRFSYTFPTAGEYNMSVTVYNGFDESETFPFLYHVVEPYSTDEPVITSVHFNHWYNHYSCHTVSVDAIGGSEPYRYCYTISGRSDEVRIDGSKLGAFQVDDSAPQGEFRLTTGYIEANSVDTPYEAIHKYIPPEGLSSKDHDLTKYAELTLTVTVKDKNSEESTPYQLTFKNEDLPE